ncbi:serine/threonine-protein kinase MRCK alpha isoform X2 [Strongylocentrotus purpuratus]|uniref:non-specific serine/threonine protein kinase n=1 Tax=Strongylocentrotus purpuratus TaxID=7668 RepID=A0A7M7PR38_STRPU|nr:serine/threonine-protein kinase MRCK alpha isoform X2 [Strongylocentrotus purpuratus]
MSNHAEARLKHLEKLYLNGVPQSSGATLSLESLLDALVLLHDECHASTLRREKSVTNFLEWAKLPVKKVKDLRLHKEDFETLKIIGRGAFGEVAVVKLKNSDDVFAMKLLNKWEMLKRAETACFVEERDVLVHGDSRWITNLHYAFQDDDFLYLVMDYYSGGDLLTLISKFDDRLPEDMARFYVAEMVLAIDSVHMLRYVHRDIKPDNVLLDKHGHIRLADFGSCLRMLPDNTVMSNVAVGTPDYISPEILRAMEDGKGRYGPECDWWSLGVCMYEMLFGETPFYAESLVETYGKIMNHKNQFDFPPETEEEVAISEDAKDLILSLICSAEARLGRNGLQDFKDHPFFNGIDWQNIRNMTPPYVPDVKSATDTSNFDVDEADLRNSEVLPPSSHAAFTGNHLPFLGYTFTRNSNLSDLGKLADVKEVISSGIKEGVVDSAQVESLERRINKLETEKTELTNRVSELKSSGGGENDEVRRLQEEIKSFKSRIAASEAESKNTRDSYQAMAKEMQSAEDEKSSKIKTLERTSKLIKQEKENLEREVEEIHERNRQLNKEMKEAKSQGKLAMQEFTEINERYADIMSQKQKLSRDLRDKEEEIEVVSQKVDSQRADIRKHEQANKELEALQEDFQVEIAREKKLRQQSDQNIKQLQDELEGLKVNSVGRAKPDTDKYEKEVARLKQEMEKKEVQYAEGVAKEKSRHTIEEKILKEQVNENEDKIVSMRREITSLQDKLGRLQTTSTEDQHAKMKMDDMKRNYERTKALINDDKTKLSQDLDKTLLEKERLQRELRLSEEKLEEMSRNKDSVAHWEAQIAEIIQWVSDEKDARGYLQALASKMTDELESIKVSGIVGAAREKSWQSRRSQRMDRMELLNLQSNLRSEIQAKEQITEELKKVKAAHSADESKLRSSEARNTELTDEVAKLTTSVTELEQQLQELKQNAADKAGSNLSFAFLDNLDRYLDVDTKLNFDFKNELKRLSLRLQESDMDPPERDTGAPVEPVATDDKSVHSSGTSSGETPPPTPKHKTHKFMITNFQVPAKCAHCTSLMLGQSRQGMMCEVCHFACHVACAEKAPSMCPISQQQMAKPQGIDPTRGIGTAYEGVLRIPKPGGVRKGWMKQFVVVCDFKLFLFDVLDGRASEPTNDISHILDMRDEEFSVSSVLASDVIHAPSKDVPCIFKVSVSQLNPPGLCAQLLLLADSEAEKRKWVDALNNLQRHLKHNQLPDRTVFRAQEVFDSSMPLVKVTHCADIVDASRFVIGTEDGLYTVEISSGFIVRVDRKQIHQVRVLKDEQLVIVISGRGRHLRLFPIACLDGEATVIKVEEPRGCTMFTTGIIRQGSTTCMCVAMKRTVLIYEFNRNKGRHKRIKEVTLPAPAQCMEVFGGRLCAGYTSGFGMFSIQMQGQHVEPLLNIDDPSLRFLIDIPTEALAAVQISEREYLLCFSTLGVYVDFQGRRTREQELMWPSHPTEIAFNSPYLIVYSDISVDIYDIGIMEWVQTIPIKGTRQLSWDGSLNLSFVTDLHAPRLVYFHNRLAVSDHEKLNIQTVVKSSKQQANKRKFSFKSKDEIRKNVIISAPSNFSHITHMGPGDSLSKLQDIPGAESKPVRIKSMVGQPLPAQRSVTRQRPNTVINLSRDSDQNGQLSLAPSGAANFELSLTSRDGSQGSQGSPDLSGYSPRHSLGEEASSSGTPPTPHRMSYAEQDQS